MAGTRKVRVPVAEQIRHINECRQSDMTDAILTGAAKTTL